MKRKAFLSGLLVLSALSLVLLRSEHAALGSRPAVLGGTRAESLALQADGLAGRGTAMQHRSAASYGELPLAFEINRGRTDSQVRFLARGGGYTLFLTGDGAVLSLQRRSPEPRLQSQAGDGASRAPAASTPPALIQIFGGPNPQRLDQSGGRERMVGSPDVVRMRLLGADTHAEVVGVQELPGKANYFIGNDPRKWRTNVATFARVKYKNVYPGVDLVYYGKQGQLEYDFEVAPGADPNAITLALEKGTSGHEHAGGRKLLEIDNDGELTVRSDNGEVRFHKPIVYQPVDLKNGDTEKASRIRDSKLLDGHYVLTSENRVHFEVAGYDKSKPLVIDPVLTYSTYLGGSGDDSGSGIALDSSGNAYVTGTTSSTNFPTMNPVYSTSTGTGEAFVAKLNAAGNAIVYSTYLGGTGGDVGNGIAIDASGNAYVVGHTCSVDFPTTLGVFQSTFRGSCPNGISGIGGDAFVTKLNAAGNALAFSTFLAGTGGDYGSAVAVDSSGNAYVTGSTQSTDFPTQTPLQVANAGNGDAFVTKLNSSGSALVYSTYLGGGFLDQAFGIAVDSSGNAYVTGWTDSGDFPTANAFQTGNGASYEGDYDVFVSKLNATGSALVYSTYLIGDFDDAGNGIAVDSSGEAFVTGYTRSDNFPVTPGAFQTGLANPSIPNFSDAFVTKLSAAGNSLVYSTYLGGNYDDSATGIALDSSRNAYVTGSTQSGNTFPVVNSFPLPAGTTTGAIAFVTKVSPTGSALAYSTFLTGHSGAGANAIAVDGSGNAYITGGTQSTDFPTVNAFQTASRGNGDAFVAKLSPANASGVSLAPSPLNFSGQVVNTTSSSQTVVLQNVGSATLNISNSSISGANSGDFAIAGSTCGATVISFNTCNLPVTFTPSASGSRTASLTISDDAAGGPQIVTLNGTGEDFGVAVASGSSSSATVAAGGTATYTVSVSPLGGFNQAINLSCKGAPTTATCTPSPAAVTLDGTNSQNVTVTVTTTARGMLRSSTRLPEWPRTPKVPLLTLPIGFIFVVQVVWRRRVRSQIGFALLLLCIISLVSLAACGGGSSSPPPPSGTPAGTYSLTLAGASGGASHSLQLTLTVQ